MNSKELLVKAQTAFNEAKALQAKYVTPTKEQLAEIDAKLGEYDVFVAQAKTLQRIEAGDANFSEPAVPPVAWRGAGQEEGNAPVDRKAWREFKLLTVLGERSFRYHVPIAVEAKGYPEAYEAYLRRGMDNMGPNDRKTLTLGTDTAGGFTAPEVFYAELLRRVAVKATVRQVARVIQVSSPAIKWPRINYTTDNKYTSPVRMTWTGEAPATASVHRVTDPTFGLVDVPVHTAMASMPMSNDLLEDSAFDLLGIGAELMGEAFALGENDAFLNNVAAGKPLGILANVASAESTTAIKYVISGTSAKYTTSGDAHEGLRLNNLYYDLPAQYRGGAIWMTASDSLAAIDNLVDASKRPILQAMSVGNLGSNVEPSVIKGKRIMVDEFVPAMAADSYSLIFADFNGYLIADRVSLSLQRLTDSAYSELNLTGLLARKRVGGQVIEQKSFRVMKLGTS